MISDECEDELAQLSWTEGVPAPVDADGKLVHLSTDMLYTRYYSRFCVEEIGYSREKSDWIVYGHREHPTRYNAYSLRDLHLSKPDSWERLEEDARNTTCEYFGCDVNTCDACPGNDVGCTNAIIEDVIRRAKALAGVTQND